MKSMRRAQTIAIGEEENVSNSRQNSKEAPEKPPEPPKPTLQLAKKGEGLGSSPNSPKWPPVKEEVKTETKPDNPLDAIFAMNPYKTPEEKAAEEAKKNGADKEEAKEKTSGPLPHPALDEATASVAHLVGPPPKKVF
jgi:hypothetical protein